MTEEETGGLEETLDNLPKGWFVSSEAGLVHGEILAETAECWFVMVRKTGLPLQQEANTTPLPGLTAWSGIVKLSKANTTRMPDDEGWL